MSTPLYAVVLLAPAPPPYSTVRMRSTADHSSSLCLAGTVNVVASTREDCSNAAAPPLVHSCTTAEASTQHQEKAIEHLRDDAAQQRRLAAGSDYHVDGDAGVQFVQQSRLERRLEQCLSHAFVFVLAIRSNIPACSTI